MGESLDTLVSPCGAGYAARVPNPEPDGRRFGEVAAAYERGRPEYPAEVVSWLLGDDADRVIDLGAGTGKLTRALLDRVGHVIAVEPDAGMRAEFSRQLPGTSVLDGTGEDIPVRAGWADVVVVGQAWHWVDPRRAAPEVARVLRPGGLLGLAWNDRDVADPWLDRLADILVGFGTSPDVMNDVVVGPPFGPSEVMEHRWTDHVSVASVVDMIASRSYVIALSAERRAELVRQVTAWANEGADAATGLVPIRYRTQGYRFRAPG
jgi:SAM-dependent methyltransferase